MEILEALHDGLLLLDGAMGTMLQSRGLRLGERPELFSITHPQVVEGIHREYIEAGAQVVYANTFGANAHKLAGTGHTPAEVIEASVRAAKAACAGTNATKVAVSYTHLKNPRCITAVETDVEHIFRLADRERHLYRCIYCEQEFDR